MYSILCREHNSFCNSLCVVSLVRKETTLQIKKYKTRNYRYCRNGNLCKGTQVSKVIAEAKIDAFAVSLNKSTGFSAMYVTPNLLCFRFFTEGGVTCKWALFPGIDAYFYLDY